MRELATALDTITGRLLETMFYSAVLDLAANAPPETRYTAMVPFSGSLEGSVCVSASPRTAAALAANFLGESGEVSAAQAASVVGELANILCGSLLGEIERTGQFVIGAPELFDSPSASSALEEMPLRRIYELEEGTLAVGLTVG